VGDGVQVGGAVWLKEGVIEVVPLKEEVGVWLHVIAEGVGVWLTRGRLHGRATLADETAHWP